MKDRKNVQLGHHFLFIDTEGPAISDVRGISAKQRYYTPARVGKGNMTYMYSNGISYKVNQNNFRGLLFVEVVSITFELMLDCAHTLPSIYDSNFLATCLTALHFLPPLFPAAFHSSNLSPLKRLFSRFCFLLSGTLVHFVLVSLLVNSF